VDDSLSNVLVVEMKMWRGIEKAGVR
jgi:hypothetical protein